MTKLEELLGKAAEETVDKAAQEALEERIPNANIEAIWDKYRKNFRGTEIRGKIHEAQDKLNAGEVLITKLKNMSIQAEKLIPILKEVMTEAEIAIKEVEAVIGEKDNE